MLGSMPRAHHHQPRGSWPRRKARQQASHQLAIRSAATGHRAIFHQLPEDEQRLEQAREQFDAADERIEHITGDPLIAGRSDRAMILAVEHNAWSRVYHTAKEQAQRAADLAYAREAGGRAQQRMRQHEHDQPYQPPNRD